MRTKAHSRFFVHINLKTAHNTYMSKRKHNKMIEDVFEQCVSANECTGLFQKVALDPDEVRTFPRMYNDIDDADSIEP